MEAPDYDEWATGRLLSTAARLTEHAWNAHLAAWDLTHAGVAVLHVLGAGPSTQRELAAAVGVQEQTIGRTVERLERSGYVERARHDQDRRRMVVRRTSAGETALAQAADEETSEQMLTGPLGSEVTALRAALVTIIRARSGDRWGA